MKNIIIGTAGHVDHGKTQLIKALSGIDTDRLSEEKKRGITIELGFAHIPNEEGYNIGVIDVPGHEKFIKNMLAGIGGIDFVLFVVAADEGIMPQTREHFEIIRALGIDDGIIAVTKKDMVDDEWLEMLLEDVTDYFKGTFLEGKPLIACSSKTGENIDLLKEEIIKKCNRNSKRSEDPRLFRLPVDRVFTIPGFGTVITGTLVDGLCSINEEIRIYPDDISVKIRGIQTHGSDVKSAVAGQRTAINLGGIKKEEVERGAVLAREGAVTVTSMIDVKLDVFESSDRVILNNSRVHIYQGSKEAICKVILLDRDSLTAGETAYAQLRLEEPIAIRRGDRFIVRFYSPVITIGGGVIIDAMPEKHKRNRAEVLDELEIMSGSDIEATVLLKAGGRRLYNSADLSNELGILPEKITQAVSSLSEQDQIAELEGGVLVSKNRLDFLEKGLTDIVGKYHEENPLAAGIPKQELLSRLKGKWYIEDEKILSALLARFINTGAVSDKGKAVSLGAWKVEYTDEQKLLKNKIAKMYEDAGIEMIKNEDVFALNPNRGIIGAILEDLTAEKVIVKVDPTYYISSSAWSDAVEAVFKIGSSGPFTLADYRDHFGTSRKYAEPILLALDRQGITSFDKGVRTLVVSKR